MVEYNEHTLRFHHDFARKGSGDGEASGRFRIAGQQIGRRSSLVWVGAREWVRETTPGAAPPLSTAQAPIFPPPTQPLPSRPSISFQCPSLYFREGRKLGESPALDATLEAGTHFVASWVMGVLGSKVGGEDSEGFATK